jgi:hypothetical protein
MISIERCRKILGSKADEMDDNSLSLILSELYLLSEVIIEKALDKLNSEKSDV